MELTRIWTQSHWADWLGCAQAGDHPWGILHLFGRTASPLPLPILQHWHVFLWWPALPTLRKLFYRPSQVWHVSIWDFGKGKQMCEEGMLSSLQCSVTRASLSSPGSWDGSGKARAPLVSVVSAEPPPAVLVLNRLLIAPQSHLRLGLLTSNITSPQKYLQHQNLLVLSVLHWCLSIPDQISLLSYTYKRLNERRKGCRNQTSSVPAWHCSWRPGKSLNSGWWTAPKCCHSYQGHSSKS